jgi:hypothetical protein
MSEIVNWPTPAGTLRGAHLRPPKRENHAQPRSFMIWRGRYKPACVMQAGAVARQCRMFVELSEAQACYMSSFGAFIHVLVGTDNQH